MTTSGYLASAAPEPRSRGSIRSINYRYAVRRQFMVDTYYPFSANVESAATGKSIGQIGLIQKLRDYRQAAQRGDLDLESRLINRIGQIRRSVPDMSKIIGEVRDELKASVEYLRSVGRSVDLGNQDPAKWITRRGESTRW